MAEGDVKVTLTLRKATADRLRAICHARNETASLVVDRWVLLHDAAGNCREQRKSDIEALADDIGFGSLFRRSR